MKSQEIRMTLVQLPWYNKRFVCKGQSLFGCASCWCGIDIWVHLIVFTMVLQLFLSSRVRASMKTQHLLQTKLLGHWKQIEPPVLSWRAALFLVVVLLLILPPRTSWWEQTKSQKTIISKEYFCREFSYSKKKKRNFHTSKKWRSTTQDLSALKKVGLCWEKSFSP